MELIVLGLNHKTAPIDLRERMAFPEGHLQRALVQMKSLPSLKENMILSTCNRVEIYGAVREAPQAFLELKDFLSHYHGLPVAAFEKSLYTLRGEEAVKHIFRVASSLDSMVIGEPQILGQIKSAYEAAVESKTSGVILHRLMHRAFHVAKRVRTETKIGDSAVSVSSIAVELARKIFESLEKKGVLLIGAGEMCELAARHLVSGGVGKVWVTNRTFERALALAREFSGEALPFDEMKRALKEVDIVISATDSTEYLIRQDQMLRVMKERKHRPLFFIDIADPRNIEPSVGDMENVYLYNIDDLKRVADENIKDRQKEAEKAETIVRDEVLKFVHWYHSLEVTPTIVALRNKFEEIRKRELEKTLSLHPNFSEKEKKSLESLTSAIINKILHTPSTLLKQTNEDAMADLYLDALRTLFQLSDLPSQGPDEEEREKENAGI